MGLERRIYGKLRSTTLLSDRSGAQVVPLEYGGEERGDHHPPSVRMGFWETTCVADSRYDVCQKLVMTTVRTSGDTQRNPFRAALAVCDLRTSLPEGEQML